MLVQITVSEVFGAAVALEVQMTPSDGTQAGSSLGFGCEWVSVCTHQKDRHVDTPQPRNGRLTARPSGKFWMPMPIARFLKETDIITKSVPNREHTQIFQLFPSYFPFWQIGIKVVQMTFWGKTVHLCPFLQMIMAIHNYLTFWRIILKNILALQHNACERGLKLPSSKMPKVHH